MTKRIHFLLLVVIWLLPAAASAEEGLGIDTADGAQHLVVCQDTFICFNNGGPGVSVGKVLSDWRVVPSADGSADGSTARIVIRQRDKGAVICYDLTGKEKHVGTAGVTQQTHSTEWTTNMSDIQVAKGPFKGYYLSPGTEKIELEAKDGKMVAVGTRPILTKEPYHWKFVDVSP